MKTKKLKKKIREKQIRDRANALMEKILPKLLDFKATHGSYLNCYPSGIRYSAKKKIMVSESLRKNIYFCKFHCNRQCNTFLLKVYLCRDIGCDSYPVCATTKDRNKVVKICKETKLNNERRTLNREYNKFFKWHRIYRGLKLSPEQTIRYLKAQRDKEDGKIRTKKITKKKKRNRKK